MGRDATVLNEHLEVVSCSGFGVLGDGINGRHESLRIVTYWGIRKRRGRSSVSARHSVLELNTVVSVKYKG